MPTRKMRIAQVADSISVAVIFPHRRWLAGPIEDNRCKISCLVFDSASVFIDPRIYPRQSAHSPANKK